MERDRSPDRPNSGWSSSVSLGPSWLALISGDRGLVAPMVSMGHTAIDVRLYGRGRIPWYWGPLALARLTVIWRKWLSNLLLRPDFVVNLVED